VAVNCAALPTANAGQYVSRTVIYVNLSREQFKSGLKPWSPIYKYLKICPKINQRL